MAQSSTATTAPASHRHRTPSREGACAAAAAAITPAGAGRGGAGPAVRGLSPYRDARVALVAPITGDVIPRHTLARPPGTAEYRRLRAVEPG